MSKETYKYPLPIRVGKAPCKILVAILPVLMLAALLLRRSYNGSLMDYAVLILAIPILMIGCLYYVGSWSDLTITDEGVYVEFLWSEVFVAWSDIISVKYFGIRSIGYWIIGTKGRLTKFHYLFGIGRIPLVPSFHIHRSLEQRQQVISRIQAMTRNRV